MEDKLVRQHSNRHTRLASTKHLLTELNPYSQSKKEKVRRCCRPCLNVMTITLTLLLSEGKRDCM